jgi:Flp pilus assembly protein TadG
MRNFKRVLNLSHGDRGNVFVIVLATLTVLFMFSGLALDIGHIIAVKHQLKTAMDAGSLAGASYLSLDPQSTSNQDAARATASSYAGKNMLAGGAPTLSAPNDNSGNVKTGLWNGSAWTAATTAPSGSVLNAVRCEWNAPVTPAFLGLFGFSTINVKGTGISAYGSPATPCAGCAVMPIGLPGCAFGYGASQGCGYLVWSDMTNGSTVWANLNGTSANNNDIGNQVASAYAGDAPSSDWNLNAGTFLQTTNGDVGYGNMWNNLGRVVGCGSAPSCGQFVTKYNESASNPFTIKSTDASQTTKYQGQGWEVVVPILDMAGSGCNQTGAGNLRILTWTYFVIVQVVNGGKCTVNNEGWPSTAPVDERAPWKARCDNAGLGGTALAGTAPNVNLIYGYYNCRHMDSPSTATPAPMAAFSRPTIVQ